MCDAPQLGNKNYNNGGGAVSGAASPYCGFQPHDSWMASGAVVRCMYTFEETNNIRYNTCLSTQLSSERPTQVQFLMS